jgi:hypothetical protein
MDSILLLFPLAKLGIVITELFILFPFVLTFAAKKSKLTKSGKNGEFQELNYRSALINIIVASVLSYILSQSISEITTPVNVKIELISVILFFGILYICLKPFKPTVRQLGTIFGSIFIAMAIATMLNLILIKLTTRILLG